MQTMKKNSPVIMAVCRIALLIFVIGVPAATHAAPEITGVCDPQTLYEGNATATLWADVSPESAEKAIVGVLADIYPPDNPSEPATVELSDPEKDGRYEGVYENFVTEGDYPVMIRAEDSAGETAYGETTVSVKNPDVLTPDEYEEDDTRDQAGVIIINNTDPQHHHFHDAGDADWVRFYGIDGQNYVIRAGNLGETSDITAEIHDADSSAPLETRTAEGTDLLEMEYSPPAEGIYYVRLFSSGGHLGKTSAYDLEVALKDAPEGVMFEGNVTDAFSKNPLEDVRIKTSEEKFSSLSEDGSGAYGIYHTLSSDDLKTPFLLYARIVGYGLFQKAVFTTENGFMEPVGDTETPGGGDRKISREELRPWAGEIEMVLCDINGDGKENVADAIIALRASAGMDTQAQEAPPGQDDPPKPIRPDYADSGADANGDNKVGTEEAISILRYLSESAG